MPTYEFQCPTCGLVDEAVFSIKECPDTIPCHNCGNQHSKKIISKSAVFCESPTWIDDNLRNAIQGDGEKPIETRSDLAAHCKKHDLVAVG